MAPYSYNDGTSGSQGGVQKLFSFQYSVSSLIKNRQFIPHSILSRPALEGPKKQGRQITLPWTSRRRFISTFELSSNNFFPTCVAEIGEGRGISDQLSQPIDSSPCPLLTSLDHRWPLSIPAPAPR